MMDDRRYCNPVPFSDGKRHTNPDPYVLRWCGRYYCYATDEYGVKASVSEDLVHWEAKGYAIREEEYRNYWAPAVIYLNGFFYMYYSNVPAGEEDVHEECLKLAVSRNPLEGFQWKKTFFNKFSIDAHPFLWMGKLYLFYSVNDWMGTEEGAAGTCILLDEMKSPEEPAGNPRPVVLPGIQEEIYARNRFGDGRDWHTIEGAAPLVRGNRFWLLYSANAYVNVDYYIGVALAECRENLIDMKWEKYPSEYSYHPLLKRNGYVEGTGHNTAAKAPNMVDDWNVFHGRRAAEELRPDIEQREMYITPFYFNGNELLCQEPGESEREAPRMPEIQVRDRRITGMTWLGESGSYFIAEIWISAGRSHTGVRYGMFPMYQDECNYIEVEVLPGRQETRVISVKAGVRSVITRMSLGKDFDYTVPHLFRIVRLYEEYEVTLDERHRLRFREFLCGEEGTVGVTAHFSDVHLQSFALTRMADLRGERLRHLGRILETTSCIADGDGILPAGKELLLKCREPYGEGYTEMFSFRILRGNNRILLILEDGGEAYSLVEGKEKEFSLYHIVCGEKEYFVVDGRLAECENVKERRISGIRLCGLKIVEYQYTKNDI